LIESESETMAADPISRSNLPIARLRLGGRIDWVQLAADSDNHDHLITPEERRRVAMIRQ
jgi:hypothetical protein